MCSLSFEIGWILTLRRLRINNKQTKKSEEKMLHFEEKNREP